MARSLLGIVILVFIFVNPAAANDIYSNIRIVNIAQSEPSARDTTQNTKLPSSTTAPHGDELLNGESAEQQSKQIDLTSLLFDLNSELNVSLGVEKTDDDTFLIVEMDHNPRRNGFVFRFDIVYPGLVTDTVVIGNGIFGFNNLPTAQLPMIETQADTAKFILGSKTHRTHQRINLNKVTRELEEAQRLMTAGGHLLTAKDIKEFQLLLKSAEGNGVRILELKTDRMPKNQIQQIYGSQKLTDLVELAHYNVGEEVKMKANFKIPYRSSSTQWVIVPEKSDHSGLVYKLVRNPVVGDLYDIATIAEGFDRILPKAKKGFMWVKVKEEDGISTYSLAKEGAKLSPSVLLKYVHYLGDLIEKAESEQKDLESVIPQLLSENIPVTILDQRMSQVTTEIMNANGPMQVLRVLLREQSLFTTVEILPPAGECGQYLVN